MENFPTQEQLREIVKLLRPEDLKLVRAHFAEAFARQRRARFRLIIGGRKPVRRPSDMRWRDI